MTRPVLDRTTDEEHPSGRRVAAAIALRRRLASRWLSWALIAIAGLVYAGWLFLAALHVDDRYRLDHVSGVRMALAQYFNAGSLYPDLYDGQFYGGTRFMPIPLVLHGFAARVTGEYLASGKLVSYAAMLGLVVTMVVLLRRLGCPFPVAFAVPALVLTSTTGLAGGMDMRGDVLPLLLQLLAVWIVANTDRRSSTVAAAGLTALAFMSKLSAVWAPLAIVIWLLRRDRRRLAVFTAAYVVFVGALFLLFVLITDGRMVENVFGLSTSGVTGLRSVLVAPYRFFHLMVDVAITGWAVVPLVGLAGWVALKHRAGSIYIVSLLCALAVVLVVLTDVGTGWNQLVDLVVLSGVVIGELAARAGSGTMALEGQAGRTVMIATRLTLVWVIFSGFVVTLAPPILETVRGEVSYTTDPLSGVDTSGISVLSEDPYVPLSLDQVPVVLDPFMLPRLASEYPDAIPDLVRRIEAHEFDLVVLVEPLEPVDRPWWIELDLGIDVARAISGAYTYLGRAHGYYLYEPQQTSAVG